MKKIYYYNMQSQYNVLIVLQNAILEEFKKYGYQPTLRTPLECPDPQKDTFFCFNGVFQAMEHDYITSHINTSYSSSLFTTGLVGVTFLVDDPTYHITRVNKIKSFPNTICYVLDESHPFFLKKFFDINAKHIGHIGTKGQIVDFEEKEYDFFIAGTFQDVDTLISQFTTTLDDDDLQIFEKILDTMCSKPNLHFYDIIETLLKNLTLSIDQQLLLYNKFLPIKKIYRALHRETLVKTLASLGYKITLAGNIYNEDLKNIENVNFVGTLDYETTLDYVTKSKFVLNSTPTYTCGVTERTLDTMLRKSVVLSNNSLFIEKNFKDMESILTYNLTDISGLKEKIDKVLYDKDLYNSITTNAYSIAENYIVEAFVKNAVSDIEKTINAVEYSKNVIFI